MRNRVRLFALVLFMLLATLSTFPVLSAPTITLPNPILFVTQVPVPDDYTTIASVFGNQKSDIQSVARGGDLWSAYTDGTFKNLTAAAGYGMTGMQGANAIAVRDPSVHWSGTKAIFSMVIGAPTQQYGENATYWQLYEITGLGENQTPVITKVPNQSANFNNVSPIYGTDDRIIFTTDRPRNGQAHLLPLDEYEEARGVSGLWSLDPTTGDLFLLNHAPSGAFTPSIDSFGRLVFTRWDHLQRDQQADSETLGSNCYDAATYGTFNYSDESANATRLNSRAEIFPEPRTCRNDLLAGTNLEGHTFNQFFPWTINEDGTSEEILNHIGRHELIGYLDRARTDDPNIVEFYDPSTRYNHNSIVNFLQIRESPVITGTYYGIDAPEFQTHAAGQIISVTAPVGLDADHMSIGYVTSRETASYTSTPGPANSGHYRDPLPLSNGAIIVAHTLQTDRDANIGTGANPLSRYDFRLKTIKLSGGYWVSDQPLTTGISKTVSYWDPDQLVTLSGNLWELQPVEVRARTRPARLTTPLLSPELAVFTLSSVNVPTLQAWMRQRNLALAVSRNVTTRDDADHQQPFNLKIAGSSTQTIGASGTIYSIAHLQFFQGDQLRGLTSGGSNPVPGRRVIAQVMHDSSALAANKPNPSGPPGSVALASDGSMAAFVPARRAMAWMTTDSAGNGVVRERLWITFQPGEIRVCTSCHGLNDKDQAGQTAPTNSPQALGQLLQYWKALIANSVFLPLVVK